MKHFISILFLLVFTLNLTAQETDDFSAKHPNVHKVVVKEVLQTTSYTYLNVEEHGQLQWLAVPKMVADLGDTYYYHGGMEMVDFQSKELNRTFASVMFLDGLISQEIAEGGKMVFNDSPQKNDPVMVDPNTKIDPAEGGITIDDLLSGRDKYAGKVVKIRGQVTKFSSQIMSRNWIHLWDGSGEDKKSDLTITSQEEVKVGEIVTIEGLVVLDKDFGAGYYYEVILEEGKVIK